MVNCSFCDDSINKGYGIMYSKKD
ncbi:hypothetical protein HZC08_01335, partial [Candidatus Micrarchaeota archaeon]|nr:hypothetical protein [Candidatus Micrarchaeota archaeon]